MPFRSEQDQVQGNQRKPGVLEDMARSGMAGVAQGVAGIPGMFGDIPELMDAGVDWGLGQVNPKLAAQVRAARGFQRGAMAQAGFPSRADPLTTQKIVSETAKVAPAVDYQPKTVPGQYARTVGQFATNVLSPGGALSKGAQVVLPALASETAGQLTKGSKYEAPARLAAALAGGVGTGLLANGPRGDQKILANATRGVTEQQRQAVQTLMQEAQRRGVRLTLAEAVEQVTNSATGMAGLQRYVEGTVPGKEALGPVMAARPEQVRQAATDVLDRITPAQDPIQVEMRGQAAAEGALSGVRGDINARATPDYDALQGQQIPAQEYAQLVDDPSYAAALADVRGNRELNARIAALPDNDLAVVNEVTKRLDRNARTAAESPVNPGGDNTLAGIRSGSRRNIDALLGALEQRGDVGPEWGRARATVAQGRQTELQPLTAGPVGQIAGESAGNPRLSAPQQGAALFPPKPPEGQAQVTADALATLQAQDPAIGRDLVRQHLAQQLAEGTQSTRAGPNAWGGANFGANVAGNPIQRETLTRGLGEVGANPRDMEDLLSVLEATGRRQGQGSLTEANLRMSKDLESAGSLAGAVVTHAWPTRILDRANQFLKNMDMELNARNLADALMVDPSEAAALLRRAEAAVPRDEMQRRLLLISILNANAAKTGTQEGAPNGGR